MRNRAPVTDWVYDFDHYDPDWVSDPYSLWAAMRRRCAVARTTRYGGVVFPLGWDAVRDVASDPATFSSCYVDIRDNRVLPPDFAPPITSDPPGHRAARARLAPAFNQLSVASLRDEMTTLCRKLTAVLPAPATVDVVVQYARPAAAGIIARILGLQSADVIAFQDWDVANRLRFVQGAIAARRASPDDGLISKLAHGEGARDGSAEQRLAGSVFLVLVAGVDTTAAVISGALRHLASNSIQQMRLRESVDLIPAAVEEFLRVLAPVSSARLATRDATISGCPVKRGEMVLLAFAAANRDPIRFKEPDQVHIDRDHNHHAAFGMGAHHCLGAGVARQLIVVSLEHWLTTFPGFRLANNAKSSWTAGNVRALHNLPVDLFIKK